VPSLDFGLDERARRLNITAKTHASARDDGVEDGLAVLPCLVEGCLKASTKLFDLALEFGAELAVRLRGENQVSDERDGFR